MAESSTTDEYLKALGQIVVKSTHLDTTMHHCISSLIGNDDGMNSRITAGEPAQSLLRLLAALFHYRVSDEAQLKEFDTLIDRIEKAVTKRNERVHAVWINDQNTMVDRYKRSKTNKKRFTVDRNKPSLDSLKSLTNELVIVQLELFERVAMNQTEIFRHRTKMANLTMRERAQEIKKDIAERSRSQAKASPNSVKDQAAFD